MEQVCVEPSHPVLLSSEQRVRNSPLISLTLSCWGKEDISIGNLPILNKDFIFSEETVFLVRDCSVFISTQYALPSLLLSRIMESTGKFEVVTLPCVFFK
jgi:hypothetical protein